MQTRTITVISARKLPHPIIDYANLSESVCITADLEADDNEAGCIAKLRARTSAEVDAAMLSAMEKIGGQTRASKAESGTAATADALANKFQK